MPSILSQTSWESALQFLDDAYTIAMVGPRLHDNWQQDVAPIMRREAQDPRGWTGLIPEEDDRYYEGPYYPFRPTAPDELPDALEEIDADAAAYQLVLMSSDTLRPSGIPGWPESKTRVLRDARTVLSRFTPDCVFYTNSSRRWGPSPEFTDASLRGTWLTLRPYMDLGLLAVTDTEIGLFWAIDAS
ncbi:hypothetical protein ABZ832_04740 [Streptantibioticus parmotrematis]|uniref:hypothetical protein n=1 Tax=Streptantibioticus parmotrematis TaxID=2873249 RepID=UPI0033C36560